MKTDRDQFDVNEYWYQPLGETLREHNERYKSQSKQQFIDSIKLRTKNLAIQVINLFENTPDSKTLGPICTQLIKSATSTAANYRACCRSRSKNEFHHKLSIVVEESDETIFWLEVLKESKIQIDKNQVESLLHEAKELCAIFTTARRNT